MTSSALLALLLLTSQSAQDQQSLTEPPAPPRDVTLETLADAEALRALQAPGKVLFADDFESAESLKKYFEVRGKDSGRARIVSGEEVAHRGKGAMRFDAPEAGGKESGSGASGWLGAEGHDVVYMRRYLRFADDYDQGNLNHTGGGLAGVGGTGKWDEMGKAGIRPRGDDRFTAGFEPWRDWGRAEKPGYMCLYTYWMDMQGGPDGKCWGNLLAPAEDRRVVPERGEWVCLEQMIRVNEVGKADGELAAWIDGKLYLHMKGFRWRSDERVTIKRFDVGIYIHEATRDNSVWYDDVVLSTGYVGPAQPVSPRTSR
jgi:Polysaccharide lyase 14